MPESRLTTEATFVIVIGEEAAAASLHSCPVGLQALSLPHACERPRGRIHHASAPQPCVIQIALRRDLSFHFNL